MHITIAPNINAIDAAGVREVTRKQIIPEIISAVKNNTYGYGVEMRRQIGG
jgi:hypothetical protein